MRSTPLLIACVLAFSSLTVPSVAAQQTGEIRGTVIDATGSALPGVAVTARSPSLQGLRRISSDAAGFFRLPVLPVGSYELTFEIAGFQKLTLTANQVSLGATTVVSASLQIATFAEQVTVAAVAPLTDPTSADTSYRLAGDQLERIPTQARTIAEVVALTPGVTGVRMDTTTGKDTGLPSFRGQGDAANNWLVDGLSTRGVNDNSPGVRINYDSWAEVQVISDGFEPALGQAVGGFVNIVTRSGGNAFKGEAGTLLRNSHLRAARREQLSAASLPETSIQHYFGNVGGPILKDRLWFFVSDNYFRSLDTTSDQTIGWLTIPAGERRQSSTNVFGKGTFTPWTKHTVSASLTLDSLLGQTGGIGVPETYTRDDYRDYSYRINYTGILPHEILLTAAVGQNRHRASSAPLGGDYATPSYFWQDISQQTNNIEYDSSTLEHRTDVSASVESWLDLRRWGRHQVKAGLSRYATGIEQNVNPTGSSADPWPGNGFDGGVAITWAAAGEPLSLSERQPGRLQDSTDGFGLWVQDSVQWGRVSIMAGLRTDTQRVFNDKGTNVWSWGLGDFLQPRASATIDLTGDGHTLLKIAAGRFAMPMTTQYLTWVNESFMYNMRTYAWAGPSNPSDAELKAPASWAFQWEQSGAASPVEVDPAIEPDRVSKLLVAFERQVWKGWALRVRGVYSSSTDLLEDVAVYAPDTPSEIKYLFTNFEYKRRDYRAFELELNGRIGTSFTLDASYTWSRGRGTNPGNAVERGTWNSNSGSIYDGGVFGDRPYMPPGSANKEFYDEIFTGLGGRGIGDEGWYGYLPYSVDHDVKLLATWLAPRAIRISASVEYLSGYHWEERGWCAGYGAYTTFPEGRGVRTTPAHAYVDVSVEKEFKVSKGVALALGLNAYNLFNSQQPVSFIQEDTDLFGQVWGRQLPRWVQITAAVKF